VSAPGAQVRLQGANAVRASLGAEWEIGEFASIGTMLGSVDEHAERYRRAGWEELAALRDVRRRAFIACAGGCGGVRGHVVLLTDTCDEGEGGGEA
jgi:hypothetical protein